MDIIVIGSSKSAALSAALARRLPEHVALRAQSIRGVDYVDGELRFDERLHTEKTAALLTRRLKGEQLAVEFQGGGEKVEVTDEDLRIINEQHSQLELSKEDVVVFQDYAANDNLTRKPLRLTKRALERFAENYREGRTLRLDHDVEKPVGSTFAARVVEDTMRGVTANWLVTRSFAVTKNASERRLQRIQDMQTGVKRYTSIGLMGGAWEFREIETEDETIYFYEVDDNPGERDRLEADELSRVDLGAVYGAGDNRAKNTAQSNAFSPDTDQSQDREETILCAW